MKLVRLVPITLANLTSDVPQTETLWDNATPFGLGAAVYQVIDGVPMAFISKSAGNAGHLPSADTTQTYWDPQGATNRWAAFDRTIQTQTWQADLITSTIQLAPDQAIDTVRLGNIAADTVRVVQTDAIEGVVFDETFDLTSDGVIGDYLEWFSEPIVRKAGITIPGLNPLYPGAEIRVELSAPGNTVAMGILSLGLSIELGGTKWGTELSFRDLSVKAEDPFGGLYIAKRTFKRSASFDVIVQAAFVDELQRLLEEYRAEPVLLIGNPDYDTQAIYGFIKSYKTLVNWPDHSLANIESESLA